MCAYHWKDELTLMDSSVPLPSSSTKPGLMEAKLNPVIFDVEEAHSADISLITGSTDVWTAMMNRLALALNADIFVLVREAHSIDDVFEVETKHLGELLCT